MKLFKKLRSALIEREVEDAYNEGISFYFPKTAITHPYGCDGLVETEISRKLLKLVIEYKFEEKLSERVSRAKVLAQVVFYLKRFEMDGNPIPNVCLVGDRKECFVMKTGSLVKYLSLLIDWTIAPSSAHTVEQLVWSLAEDGDVNPFVFEIDETFDFKDVADKIKDCVDDVPRYVRLTEKNFKNVYRYFREKVVKGRKPDAFKVMAAFIGVVTNPDDFYVHPSKKNTLVLADGTTIQVDSRQFDAFFSHFERKYTPSERTKFTEIADRIIDDESRRRNGDFFTPPEFVDIAHSMISKWLGDDWKEKYVVWDNSAGTKNLTRDYRFGELYSSTLKREELSISSRYNKEGTSFQYDFLNDSFEKLPEGLRDAIEKNKDILFFFNPPYATACTGMAADGRSKANVAKNTKTAKEMRKTGFGLVAEALHAQFLYRCLALKRKFKLTNLKLAFFCNPVFLTGPKYAKFRKEWNSEFEMKDGILFKASYFDECSDNWAITFNLWENGCHSGNSFLHRLVAEHPDTLAPYVTEDVKDVYNVDGVESLSEWVRKPVTGKKAVDAPNLSSGTTVKDSDTVRGTSVHGAIGYFLCNANNVQKNAQMVGLFTSPASVGNGVPVTKDNLMECIQAFAARKLVEDDWICHMDEYLAPKKVDDEFLNDAIVYSLFNSKSQQSSLRGIQYHGMTWDVKNEFFWMSRKRMMDLANKNDNDEVYQDARTDKDRILYGIVSKAAFSPEAKAVLDEATKLVEDSFKYRKPFDESYQDMQLLAWDAGWYQVKAVLKEYMPERLEKFRELYRTLSDKMRPKVYEFEFLKR